MVIGKVLSLFWISIFIHFVQITFAQSHQNFWSRATISLPIHKAIKMDLEYQNRRQNGFGNSNLLEKELMESIRVWLKYSLNNNVLLEISPFAYFQNHKIILEKSDEMDKPIKEYRLSAAIEQMNSLTKRLYWANKTGLDFRFFEQSSNNLIRVREKLYLKYELLKNWQIILGDEILLNLTNASLAHLLDHNRLYLSSIYQFSPFLKVELGYMKINRLQKSSMDLLNENNLILNCTYTFKNIKKNRC